MSEPFPKTIGRYELISRLAMGGMAELFLARPHMTSASMAPVVIKRLLPHMANDPHFNAMFLDEARLTNRLAHPNIAGTYELGRHGEQLYMVMEYIDGIDCLAVLRECARRKMRLPLKAAVYIAYQVLEALDFAHNQVDDNGAPLHVVHRDISPSNILLSRRGEVKLVDFGIARAARQEHQTKDGTLKGKYGYMSPEQVLDGDIDARSDLFSAGIVLAELLTGRRLFAARNDLDVLLMVRDVQLSRLERYGTHIDDGLHGILRTALQKQPQSRYQTAAAFRDELGSWITLNASDVGEVDIAQIVEVLYHDVRGRQREAVEPAAKTAEPGAPKTLADERESAPAIPGPKEASDELPYLEIINTVPSEPTHPRESQPSISVTFHASESRAVTKPNAPAAGGDVPKEEASDESLPVDLDDLVSGPNVSSSLLELLNSKVGWDARDFDDELVSSVGSRSHKTKVAGAGGQSEAAQDAPDDNGDFATSSPISVLYRLATTRATGLLLARVGGIRKDVYFRSGIPEYVSSNVNAERFGEYLVNQGVLEPRQLSQALALMPHYQGKLGDTLVALDLLGPLDVFRMLTKQVRHKLIDLCTWSSGTFSWYGGRENPTYAFPLDLNAFEIMGAGAMQLPDSVVQRWREPIAGSCRPTIINQSRVGIEVFQRGSFLTKVFEDLHSYATLDEFHAFYRERKQEDVFVRALYLLVHTQFVAFDD